MGVFGFPAFGRNGKSDIMRVVIDSGGCFVAAI
jgi:hypothetical protein